MGTFILTARKTNENENDLANVLTLRHDFASPGEINSNRRLNGLSIYVTIGRNLMNHFVLFSAEVH